MAGRRKSAGTPHDHPAHQEKADKPQGQKLYAPAR